MIATVEIANRQNQYLKHLDRSISELQSVKTKLEQTLEKVRDALERQYQGGSHIHQLSADGRYRGLRLIDEGGDLDEVMGYIDECFLKDKFRRQLQRFNVIHVADQLYDNGVPYCGEQKGGRMKISTDYGSSCNWHTFLHEIGHMATGGVFSSEESADEFAASWDDEPYDEDEEDEIGEQSYERESYEAPTRSTSFSHNIRLSGSPKNVAKIEQALEFYSKDSEMFEEVKRHVRSINCDFNECVGRSNKGGNVELNASYGVGTIAATLAHETYHELDKDWSGDREYRAEQHEHKFWQRRKQLGD